MWDLPSPGLEPVSPALAGRLSTTAPPGKPLYFEFLIRKITYLSFVRFFFPWGLSCSFFGTYSSVSLFYLTVCVGFYALDETATSLNFKGLNFLVQPCPRYLLSLKLLWLSKWPILFLIAPSSWGCAKTSQGPKGKDLSQHLDSGWLEARSSGNSF